MGQQMTADQSLVLVYGVTDDSRPVCCCFTGDSLQVEGSKLIQVKQLQLNKLTVKVDEDVSMVIHLHSYFPQPLTCDIVQLALSPCVSEHLEQVVDFPLPTAGIRFPFAYSRYQISHYLQQVLDYNRQ